MERGAQPILVNKIVATINKKTEFRIAKPSLYCTIYFIYSNYGVSNYFI